ncbi:carbonic anhydrase 9 [Vipera latastei]
MALWVIAATWLGTLNLERVLPASKRCCGDMLLSCMKRWCRRAPLLSSLFNRHPLPSSVLLGLPKKMTLSGGGFPQPYQADQLHLHWGSGQTRPGSEHTVDGHRYAGEIHVVHYNSRFESVQEAASKPGGLAVLAVFLQVGMETNEPYQHILKHLSEIKEEGEETVVAGFDVAKLLPDDFGRYFRYNGSLTTPPCYQTVNWTVFNQTVRLSQEQISLLEDTLRGDEDEPIQSNFRLPQDLYGRSVFSSFHSLEKVQPTGGGPLEEGGGRTKPEADGAPRDRPDPPDSGKGTQTGHTGPGGGPLEEGGGRTKPEADGGLSSPLPDGAPRDRLDPPDSGKGTQTGYTGPDAEKQVDASLHTGDILAIVFGSLFVATALAFLFYIHKHRRLASRHRGQATKPAALYAPASTDEQAL